MTTSQFSWILALLCAGVFGTSCATAPPADANTPDSDGDSPASAATFTGTLWIPPVLTGTTFNLAVAKATKALRPGALTNTYGFNGGDFWGPTLILRNGDDVQINVTNNLPEATTTHWHGLHILAIMDGGPHQPIAPGQTWSPHFQVKNRAGTFWYHPHLDMKTMEQLAYGAGGLIIVQDAEEAALALPRTYGVDDIPLVLTSRRFTGANQFDLTASFGDYVLANGVINATAALPAQIVRLRILNAETERSYRIGFDDGRTFQVIGNDGGLLSAPVPETNVTLSVGERIEILVDLSKESVGRVLTLQAFNGGQGAAFPGGEDATTGEAGSLLNNRTFDLLQVHVVAATPGAVTTVPAVLVANTYWTAADATNQRKLTILESADGTQFTFDGATYAMDVINQTVALNATEAWTIQAGPTSGHAFHIHDVQFKIVARSSGILNSWEPGWKDTVFVPASESVTFVAQFADFASPTEAFMYHCHMTNHEDGGLMGQFLVTQAP